MISPDGKRIAIAKQEGSNQDVWLLETTRNVLTRFTFDPGPEGSQVWSRDGTRIYFSANRTGKFTLYQKASNGLGAEEVLSEGDRNVFPDTETPDGKYLLYEIDNGAKFKFDIFAMPLFGDRKPFPVIQTEFTETHASVSPDGRWIMYSSDESGRSEVYVRSFPSSEGKWQISTAGGDQAMWNPNGKEIIYLGFDRNLYSVPYTSGSTFEAGEPTVLFTTRLPQTGLTDERNNYLITPDGQRLLLNNLVDETLYAPLIVVMNWESGQKR
jgi:serine/threonine-protein kinase